MVSKYRYVEQTVGTLSFGRIGKRWHPKIAPNIHSEWNETSSSKLKAIHLYFPDSENHLHLSRFIIGVVSYSSFLWTKVNILNGTAK